MSIQEGLRFAKAALARGLLSREAVRDCLEEAVRRERRGEEAPIGRLLHERGHLSTATLVRSALLLAGPAAPDADGRGGRVLPRIVRVLLAEGRLGEGDAFQALAVQDSLQAQGIAIRIEEVLVHQGLVDAATLAEGERRPVGAPPPAGEAVGSSLPDDAALLAGADREDRLFAKLAIALERVGRIQVRHAFAVQSIYARHRLSKRLYEILEELRWLTSEETEQIRLVQARRMEIAPRPERVERPTRLDPARLSIETHVSPRALAAARALQSELAGSGLERPLATIALELGGISPRGLARLERRAVAATGVRRVRDRAPAIAAASVAAFAIALIAAGPWTSRIEPVPVVTVARQGPDEDGGRVAGEMARRAPARDRQVEPVEASPMVVLGGEWVEPAAALDGSRQGPEQGGSDWVAAVVWSGPMRPIAPPEVPVEDAKDWMALQATHEIGPRGARVRIAGAADLPDGTVVAVEVLVRATVVLRTHAALENGAFEHCFDQLRPLFPGTWMARVEIDGAGQPDQVTRRIGAGSRRFAREVEFEVEPAQARPERARAREEIESSLAIARSFARALRASPSPAAAVPIVAALRLPSVRDGALGRPFASARKRLDALAGMPCPEDAAAVGRLESELDRVEAVLWREELELEGSGAGFELVRLVEDEAREDRTTAVAPARETDLWLLARTIERRAAELGAAQERARQDQGATWMPFASKWLPRLRLLSLSVQRLAGSNATAELEAAIAALGRLWCSATADLGLAPADRDGEGRVLEARRSEAAALVAGVVRDLGSAAIARRILDRSFESAGALLAESRQANAGAGWTSRLADARGDARRIAAADPTSERARALVEALASGPEPGER